MKRFLKPAIIILVIVSAITFFLSRPSYKTAISVAGYDEQSLAKNAALQVPSAPSPERKIITSGQVAVIVKVYDPFYKSLEQQLQQVGGYVSNLEATRDSGSVRWATITIRIPPARTNLMVSWLREQGMIQSENIKAEDVSEEYYDIQARLQNAKRLEARLLDMVQKNTGKLADLVLLEEKIGEVRENIEQMEGRIRNMDRLISLATLTLNVQVQSSTTVASPTFASRALHAWKHSLKSLKEVSQSGLLALIAILPWILPVGLAVVVLMFVFKGIRRVFRTRTA
ncbi:DUF4349 domain-containing protein [bacterium]|nr:DUF4349 domain-containing protein [bacterium]